MERKRDNRLGARRQRKRLTQEQLAAITGIGRTKISAYETGRETPDRNNILKLARGLDCRTDDIFADLGLIQTAGVDFERRRRSA